MFELIVFIIFVASVIGLIFILGKKMPELVELPKDGSMGVREHPFVVNIENKIKEHHFAIFKKQLWLHKLLSFIKVWTLKAETKIDQLLHGIRKKAQELDKTQVENSKTQVEVKIISSAPTTPVVSSKKKKITQQL